MWRLIVTLVVVGALSLGSWLGWREATQPGLLPLTDIRVKGLTLTKPERVLEALRLRKGINLLTVSPKELRERLEKQTWVRRADVRRVFPDTLEITVEERVAVALGREGDRLVLLDQYGQMVRPLEPDDPLLLPVVTVAYGSDRPSLAVEILNLLGRHPWLKARVDQVQAWPGRRWVLHTHEGVRILLAGEDAQVDAAITFLHRLQEKHKLLDRAVAQVDLRVPGRAAVKPDRQAPAARGELAG